MMLGCGSRDVRVCVVVFMLSEAYWEVVAFCTSPLYSCSGFLLPVGMFLIASSQLMVLLLFALSLSALACNFHAVEYQLQARPMPREVPTPLAPGNTIMKKSDQ